MYWISFWNVYERHPHHLPLPLCAVHPGWRDATFTSPTCAILRRTERTIWTEGKWDHQRCWNETWPTNANRVVLYENGRPIWMQQALRVRCTQHGYPMWHGNHDLVKLEKNGAQTRKNRLLNSKKTVLELRAPFFSSFRSRLRRYHAYVVGAEHCFFRESTVFFEFHFRKKRCSEMIFGKSSALQILEICLWLTYPHDFPI